MSKGRRHVLTGMVALLAVTLTLSACSTNNTSSNGESVSPPATGQNNPVNGESSAADETIDPLGKYDPPIDLSVVRSTEWLTFDDENTIDDNIWYDAYLRDLGIKVSNMWTVPSGEAFQSKLNVSISSNDIPDLLNVNAIQLKTLVEAGMIEDLTEIYEKYASEDLKEIMGQDNNQAIHSSSFDGKMYAIPALTPAIGTLKMLWIRQDWLDKLKLQPPQTTEEVLQIARAFTNDDPDGNNKKDTYGLSVNKDITSMWNAPGVDGLFQGFGAYPGSWIQDSSGKVVYGSILPEMKPALQMLNQMYKEGLIDKEFGVQDSTKVFESLNAGKTGMFYGDFASPIYANKDTILNVDGAVWNAYPLPSVDGTPANAYLGSTASSFFVVKKGYKNPEAAVKLANYWVHTQYVDVDRSLGQNAETGVAYYPYAILSFSPPLIHLNIYNEVIQALKDGDTSTISEDSQIKIESIKAYRENPKDVGGWLTDRIFGAGHSALEVVASYLDNHLYVNNALNVPTTPTMSEKMSTLNKMEITMMTRIIMGDVGIEEFDKFVQDWNRQGGEQITKEVNEMN
ncbi:extracellular solute-binding protein [Paenibacillus agaridevorans]|uniref:extracellular solute-binding protein n=1 Tax=Paenibacillus agaridevorans TaxID=171404 RepID=UPI001BE457AD|nr:extracellular solute-binding protein [Paenibacillus agaridevorans]